MVAVQQIRAEGRRCCVFAYTGGEVARSLFRQ